MKRTFLLIGIVAALLLSTAACGGLSDDEQKASDNIAKSFAGSQPSKSRKAVADCFGDELVTSAGVDQLTKDKVIDKKLKAATQLPDKLSKETAEAYGDAIVKCYDFSKLKADIKKSSGASQKDVDAYVKCMDAIDDDDLKTTIVDGYTKSTPSATVKKVNKASTECGKKLGQPAGQ
jgi:hypothetical protein